MGRLKEVREAVDITQGKLAELLGVTSSFISQAERGDKELSRDVLIRLKRSLGISIDWFLTGEGQMFHSETFDGLMDTARRKLLESGLSPEEVDRRLLPLSELAPEAKFATVANLADEEAGGLGEQSAGKCKTVLHLPDDITGQIPHSAEFDEASDKTKYDTVSHLHATETASPSALVPAKGQSTPAVLQRQPDPGLRLVNPATGEPSPKELALSKLWGYPLDVTVYRYRKGHAEPIPVGNSDPEGVVFLPVFSQTVAAGSGQEATQLVETEEVAPVLYALCQGHRPEGCGICRVVGDSMTDVTLFNGDYVVFDGTDIKGDGIFVIGMFGEMRVKRLQYRLADRKIMIASENSKRYPEPEVVNAEVVERGELRIYGRVLGWLHRHPY